MQSWRNSFLAATSVDRDPESGEPSDEAAGEPDSEPLGEPAQEVDELGEGELPHDDSVQVLTPHPKGPALPLGWIVETPVLIA